MRRQQTSRKRCLLTAGCVGQPLRRAGSVAAESDRPTARKIGESRQAGAFRRGEPARSASKTWFSGGLARKSLIVGRTAATRRVPFAISYIVFAMCRVLASPALPPLSSFSNPLKRRRKKAKET